MAEADRKVIFREIGSTGLKVNAGALQEEFQTELYGQNAVKTFREMSMNNAIVGAILFVIEQMIQKLDWKIKPFSEDNEDQEPKDFIEEAMLKDMNMSFADVLSEVLTFLTYGWSYLEVVYKMRNGPQPVGSSTPSSKFNDRKIGWRKWGLRGQETLWEWKFDESGGIAGMQQLLQFPILDKPVIPISKALLFRTRVEKNSPEGLSILRRAYTSYFYCKRFQDIEAIGIERDLQGLPVLIPPADLDIWNPKDSVMTQALSAAIKVVQKVRRGENEGLIIPNGWELSLLASPGRRQFDLNTTIARYETRMAMTCLADFIFLGSQRTGSWALSSDKTEMFVLALGGFLRRIKEVVNRHGIPTLLELNGMDSTRPPTLEHGDIETQNLAELAQYITALAGVGAIAFPDEALEAHLRLIAELPEAPDEALPLIEGEPPPAKQQMTLQKAKWLKKSIGELNEIYAAAMKQKSNGAHA